MSQYKVSGNKESGFTLSIDGRVQGVWKQMRDLHNCIMRYHNPDQLPRKEVLRLVRVAVKTDGLFHYGGGAKNSNKTQETQETQKDAILELVNKQQEQINELINSVKELTSLKEKVNYQAVEIEVLQDDFNVQQQLIKELVEDKEELELEIKNLKKKESVQEIEKVEIVLENEENKEIEIIDNEPIKLSDLIKEEEKGFDPCIENIFSGETLKKEEDVQKKTCLLRVSDFKKMNNFDFDSLQQVTLIDYNKECSRQKMKVGLTENNKLVNQLGQELGYYQDWEDDDIPDKHKSRDEVVVEPDSGGIELREYILTDERLSTIPVGIYREYEYNEYFDLLQYSREVLYEVL